MSKKIKLKLVEQTTATAGSPPPTLGAPPPTLGPAGLTLWRRVMSEYDISDAGGLAMLEQICLATDRAAQCRSIIEADGPVLDTRHGPKEHPLLKHELAARSFVVRTLARLGLNTEPVKSVGRPGRYGVWNDDN